MLKCRLRRLALTGPTFFALMLVTFVGIRLVAGDPACAAIEQRLATQPPIGVPTISFDGTDDGVRPPADAAQDAQRFTGPRSHRIVPGVGHNMPQEAPRVFADAVLELVRGAH